MNNPYIPARNRPRALFSEPFRKKETVIGTMGKTHGVRSAAKPHRMASSIMPQSEPPPAAVVSAATAVPEADVRSISKSQYCIGVQPTSLHTIHSTYPLRLAEGAVRTTFCAMVAACS